MKLTVRPLSPDLWPAVEDLFADSAVWSRCWCMYWRIGVAYRKRPRMTNKAAFREIVKRGPPPGLLAFDGDIAVGWCQVTRRDQIPQLDRSWRLERVDDVPRLVAFLLLCAKGLSQARRYLRTDRCGREDSEGGRSARARSLSSGSESDAKRNVDWYILDLRARRLQDRCAPAATASDYAARFQGSSRSADEVVRMDT